MRLQKTTVDNSVKYIPQSEQTIEKDIRTTTKQIFHFLVNKTKLFQKTIKIR